MSEQSMEALALAAAVKRRGVEARRRIAALPREDSRRALVAALEAGDLDAIPVERALRSARGIAAIKARGLMRAAGIAGNPRVRELTPLRRQRLLELLREAGQ